MAMTADQREFLRAHRLCVFGFDRREGPPSLSPVYYLMDGDDLLISTLTARGKARAVRRNAEVTLCVLDETYPFPYLTVFGRAAVVESGAIDILMRIREVMTGVLPSGDERAALEAQGIEEGRVVIRVTPERFVSTPPRGQRAQ